jgi:hypothetical protein
MSQPVVIDVAVSPLPRGTPAQSVDTLVAEAEACIQAGAGIMAGAVSPHTDSSNGVA